MIETNKKLYKVTVEVDMVVLAHNEQEAEEIARTHTHEESSYFEFTTSEVTDSKQLPGAWEIGCLPYSLDEEQLYIGQYLHDV